MTASLRIAIDDWGGVSGSLKVLGENGFTRTTGGPDPKYKRVNPYEAAQGRAVFPNNWSSPYRLSDWNSYTHSSVLTGTNLNCTSVGQTTANFSFTKPTDYPPSSISGSDTVQQALWIKQCTDQTGDEEQVCGQPSSTETPLQGAANALSDGTTLNATGLTADKWHIAAVYYEFTDNGASASHRGSAYSLAGTLTEGFDFEAGGNIILFKTDPTWTCGSTSLKLTTSGDYCDACTATAVTKYERTGGGYTTKYNSGYCFYANATDCNNGTVDSASGYTHISDGTDGYAISAGCINGSSVGLCGDCSA